MVAEPCRLKSSIFKAIKRDPVSVAAEIACHVDEGFSKFYCVDNTFNIPRTYAGELCRKLAALKCDITWSCILYPDVSAGELAHEMARAGCRMPYRTGLLNGPTGRSDYTFSASPGFISKKRFNYR